MIMRHVEQVMDGTAVVHHRDERVGVVVGMARAERRRIQPWPEQGLPIPLLIVRATLSV